MAPSKSVTVKEAGASWIKAAEAAGLERSTVEQYRQHLDRHIVPFIGTTKLSDLNAQAVRKFEDRLREEDRSPAMVRKVLTSLGSLLADAQEQGLAARTPSAIFAAIAVAARTDIPRSERRASSRLASTFRNPPRSRPS